MLDITMNENIIEKIINEVNFFVNITEYILYNNFIIILL